MNLNEIISKVSNVNEILKLLSTEYETVKLRVSQVDKLKSDILHEIEFGKLNAVQMTQKYKELQAVLKVRRKYKDIMQVMQSAQSCIQNSNVLKMEDTVKALIVKLNHRTYDARISLDLKEEILNEMI